VTELVPGDHVLPVFTGECKECAHCQSEESNLCDLLRINVDRGVMIGDGQSRFTVNGKPIFHFVGTSTFSEYTVIHVGCLAKINPEAPLDKVCVLSCGISTGKSWLLTPLFPNKNNIVRIPQLVTEMLFFFRTWRDAQCRETKTGFNCGNFRSWSCRPCCK
jgi:alcohol dehydrogenase class-P